MDAHYVYYNMMLYVIHIIIYLD